MAKSASVLTFTRCAMAGLLGMFLVACSQDDPVLEGSRFDVRDPLPTVSADGKIQQAAKPVDAGPEKVPSFRAPKQVNHANWTHRGGNSAHKIQHPALKANLSQAWSVSIGQGNSRRQRITADPIVAEGRIYTMDAASGVQATSANGAVVWTKQLIPANDDAGDASGGGLSYSKGVIFATTGFGELFALEAKSGKVIWRQRLDAPVTSSPTVVDGIVYVVSRDSRAWALDAKLGRIRWELPGTPAQSVINGGAGPAVTNRLVIFPYGSGDLVAALRKSGIRVWGSSVAGQRRGKAYADISDVTGDPVIADGVLYAANQGGRVIALNAASGDRIWTANEGSYSPVWPSGDSIFMISDQAELVRLDAGTGKKLWGTKLPNFVNDKITRRKAVFAHYGPILAGGRLIVASDDGKLRSYDPSTGASLSSVEINSGAASNPIVVGGTLYVVTQKGQLAAFR